jgi:hypothetical protein
MVARQWDRAITRLKGQDAWVKAFLPTAARRCRAKVWKFPDQAKTLAKIAESKGEAFYRGELAEAIDKYAKETGGALRRNDLESHKADWVDPIGPDLSRHDAARDPAQRPGHRRLHGARHPRELRRRRPQHRRTGGRAPQDRGDEARLRRHLALRRRSALHGSDAGADAGQAVPQEPRQADRSQEGAGFRPGRAEGRRHDLSRHGRRVGHDGVADPVELHRLRLGHRRAGTGIALHNRASASSPPRAIPTRSGRRSGRSTPSSRPSSPRTASRSRPSA